MKVDVEINPVYLPYMNKPQFYNIFYGGSSSGKSYFICQKIVLDNFNGVNWLCCRNIARTIRISTFNEINKAIIQMGLAPYYKINQSDMTITNILNKKQILFGGLDDPEKLKSITPMVGVLERIFVEEATEIKREALKQLEKRLRGASKFTKQIFLAFNPILKSHFIYKDFFYGWQDDKNSYEDDRVCILKTTYRDNLFLEEDDRRNLEAETDPYWRSVYCDGNWGILGHVIFKNWRVEDLSDKIKSFDNIRCGCDFGYSSDPNALVKMHLDKKNKRLYIFDEYYQAGMSDQELVRIAKDFFGKEMVVCDSAEPKSIDYLAASGIFATPAIKGADSINRGIRFMQGFEIIVDVRCQNFKNELEQYHWQEDKYGLAMARPVDKDNHLLDATRYALERDMTGSPNSATGRLM